MPAPTAITTPATQVNPIIVPGARLMEPAFVPSEGGESRPTAGQTWPRGNG